MKIELTNKTTYRDDDLRALIRGACSQAGVAFGIVTVEVVDSKRSCVTGYAHFPPQLPRALLGTRRGRMKIRIPRPGVEIKHGSVAQVMLHEAMHLAGARHSDMTEEQYHCRMPTSWADGLLLRVKEAPVAPDPELRKAAARADRLGHAQAMLAKAGTRLKRATTLEKKWKRRVALLSR